MFHSFRYCIPFQSIFSPQGSFYVLNDIQVELEHMVELESLLFTSELEIVGDKKEHATSTTSGPLMDGGDGVLALLGGKASALSDNILQAYTCLSSRIFHFVTHTNERERERVRGRLNLIFKI